jgi:hypothetical protein
VSIFGISTLDASGFLVSSTTTAFFSSFSWTTSSLTTGISTVSLTGFSTSFSTSSFFPK